MIQKQIGLLTYNKFANDYQETKHYSTQCPNLSKSDTLLKLYLESQKIVCKPISWDNSNALLNDIDFIIIRSTWNYYHSNRNIINFMKYLLNTKDKIYNSYEVIKWNIHKKYLNDLSLVNIPTVPTLILNVDHLTIDKFYKNGNFYTPAVIKPCISGSSYHQFYIYYFKDVTQQIQDIKKYYKHLGITEIILQPMITDVFVYGELSLIFFNDSFSHAVKKKHSQPDFNSEMLVTLLTVIPKQALNLAYKTILTAYEILSIKEKTFLYARVDLLYDNTKGYLVSELELIEPDLFLCYKEGSVNAFAEAIFTKLI